MSQTVRPSIMRQIVTSLILLGSVTAIAVFGSLASIANTEGWYTQVNKVAWNPPNALFGPAWSVLYFLIALVGFLIWRSGFSGTTTPNAAKSTLWLFTAQLLLNAIWTPIFFAGYPLIGEVAWYVALVVIVTLIASVVWLIVSSFNWSKAAAVLLVPYLLWLVFAASLNAGIIVLN